MCILKILVVGSGAIGKRHAQNIIQLGHDCEIIGYRQIVNLEKLLLDGSYDAVIVATASQVRWEVLEPCFRNLIPVYIEKPIAFDTEVIDKIYKLPNSYLKKCFAGFMMRFHPLTKFLLSLNYNNAYSFSFDIGYNVNLWRKDWKFSKSYASKQVGGGVLLDLCHEIDLANLLFSPLILNDVSCLDHKKFNDIDFISLITFTNSNNLIGTVSMDYLSPINRRKLIVKGLDYIDEIDFLSGTYKRTTSNSILIKEFPHERNQMFIDSMNIFIQNVLEKENFFLAIPSLDRVKSSSVLIKNAWKKRIFVGSVEGEMS